jgi:hypothetical protein
MEEKYHHHQRSLNGTTFYFLNDENDLSDIRTELERLDATCLQPPRDTHKNVNITHVVADYIDDWDDSWESARERIENFSTTTTTTTTRPTRSLVKPAITSRTLSLCFVQTVSVSPVRDEITSQLSRSFQPTARKSPPSRRRRFYQTSPSSLPHRSKFSW